MHSALKHKNFRKYLDFLLAANLLDTIFVPPASLADTLSQVQIAEHFQQNSTLWEKMSETVANAKPITPRLEDLKERRFIFSLSTLLYPFVKISGFKEAGKKQNLLEFFIRENVKLTKNCSNDVNKICLGAYGLIEMGENGQISAENLGMWSRGLKELWPYSVYLLAYMDNEAHKELMERVMTIFEEHDLARFYSVSSLLNVNLD